MSDEALAQDLLADARRVVVFTGAGVSAESGVPTFRGAGGLWMTYRPEELATPEAFERDPRLVWEWYGWRREVLAECRPNPAHVSLARWMLSREGVTLVTQNVDDLHERGAVEAALGLAREGWLRVGDGEEAKPRKRPAGDEEAARAASLRVAPLRLHGSLAHGRCVRCRARRELQGTVDATSEATLPRCRCGGLMRPDVVWFGEPLPADALAAAYRAAAAAEVCFVVGTAGAVYPAAGVVHETANAGGRVIVVDPGETAYDELADVRLRGAAGEVVPRVLRGLG